MTKFTSTGRSEDNRNFRTRSARTRLRILLAATTVTVAILGISLASLASSASQIKSELVEAAALLPLIKEELSANNVESARSFAAEFGAHTKRARELSNSPLWTLASVAPAVGANFAAVSEIARTADDVAVLGLTPMLDVLGSWDWNEVVPVESGANLASIETAAPKIASAAQAVRISAERLSSIDEGVLLPQVAEPLVKSREQLDSVSGTLATAADASRLITEMLGASEPRHYLLMIQNNAETRASGGIPGALAVLNFDDGKLSLGAQSSASELGIMSPALPVNPEQTQIYSTRLGKYMQDVNLTPDFPTAASTAQAIWEKSMSQRVDGVVSVDPVVLSYILESTGPIQLSGSNLATVEGSGLPRELTRDNVVRTLLSDVYAKIEQPKLQDAYFAGVAQDIFSALASGKGEARGLLDGLTRGTQEGRVLLWSAHASEQSAIAKYPLSGSITGPSVPPSQFGVYFNDGTGAKMDFYVKRTVQLIRECPAEGYELTRVRITSTNTAPGDAASTLPAYVTGGGVFGVEAGTVQTNIIAYGPAQANVESATVDGLKTPFAPHLHANRPVGIVAQQLAPQETRVTEFTFGKIVQRTQPNLVVTPSIQDVKDVVLPTESAACEVGR